MIKPCAIEAVPGRCSAVGGFAELLQPPCGQCPSRIRADTLSFAGKSVCETRPHYNDQLSAAVSRTSCRSSEKADRLSPSIAGIANATVIQAINVPQEALDGLISGFVQLQSAA